MALEKSKDEKVEQPDADEKKVVAVDEGPSSEEVKDEMIPMSQVKELIAAQLAEHTQSSNNVELGTAIANAMVKAQHENEPHKFDEFSYLSRAEISKDDWMEEPARFWALGIFLVIGDDKREGNKVPAPRGIIKFLPQGTRRKPRGKETEIQIISAYETRSKIEADWLKKHTLCGARFFEKSGEAFSVNIKYAQKVAAYTQGLMNTHANQVIGMAQAIGLDVTDDIQMLRISVAQHRATKDIENYESVEREHLAENGKNQLLLSKMKTS